MNPEPAPALTSVPASPRSHGRLWAGGCALAVAGLAVVALGVPGPSSTAEALSAAGAKSQLSLEDSSAASQSGAAIERWAQPWGSAASAQASTNAQATAADAGESTGVVLINTELGYSGGEAAGSGIVLSSDGLVLTNNHVIEGATVITVTDPSTGTTYDAEVLGYDEASDVALLQLNDATGLAIADLDADDATTVGDEVTAVGNASGGGVLMATEGTITGLEESVTTSTTAYEQGETLTGLFEFTADVVGGDSGGALLDSQGEVIGMTTAASTGLATTVAYAITIDDALAIVDQIVAGDESGTVELGYPAFLGVALHTAFPGVASSGAVIGYVYAGTPAADAGLAAGDTVTAVDGRSVTTGDELAAALAAHDPGDKVSLAWTDATGERHSATVTLAEGAAG